MYSSLCIVDDDSIFITTVELIYKRVLKSEKPLLKFTRPQEALSKLCDEMWMQDKGQIILLCDINMPGIQGFELIEKLTDFYKDKPEVMSAIKIYMLTSSISALDKKRADADPYILDFISKPLSPTKLQELLR